jgi:peptidoglycan/xylan/chitin deacetylase (PgdA/CDA1 family)
VTALGVRHSTQDVRFSVGHPVRDQVVYGPRDDLATPCPKQALPDRWRTVCHLDERTQSPPVHMAGNSDLALSCVIHGRRRIAAPLISAALVTMLLAGCGGGGGRSDPAPLAPAHQTIHREAHSRPVRRAVPVLIAPANAPDRSVRVPVLTYHRVAPLSAAGLTDLKVDPANFVAELSALKEAGYHTIHQSQLFDALYKGAALPSKPIIISVDDGYVDDVTRILPALERFHMVATFFVITGRTTEPGFVSAAQIRQLDQAGMDVEDHTAHHLDLRQLTPGELRSETAGSRRVLDRILGHPVYFFAYPFGAFNDAVLAAVKDAGFSMAYTTAGGDTESTAAPLTMPRIHVGRSETPTGLLSELGGA